jgi:hypothetical protein
MGAGLFLLPLDSFNYNLTTMKCSHCRAELTEKYNDGKHTKEYVEYILSDGSTRCDNCKGK